MFDDYLMSEYCYFNMFVVEKKLLYYSIHRLWFLHHARNRLARKISPDELGDKGPY